MAQPLIVVTNDDGVLAPGIEAAVAACEGLGEVLVCAPDTERSGSSHAITFHTHLRADPVREGWWRVSGTPVDCVYLALLHLCDRAPALVLSGINAGFNLGTDVFYSGTVGGAAEAYLRGLPAIAASTDRSADPRDAVAPLRAVVERMLTASRPHLLNVNIPIPGLQTSDDDASTARDFAVTRLGQRVYKDSVEHRTDPQGRPYYWIGGPPEQGVDREGDDTWEVRHGRVSVTPLEMDITAPDLEPVRSLFDDVTVPIVRGAES
jgi:5'-nucleotidase